ncbi:hypothetical protein ACI797_07675 [Geodermatophilus sp. SYSU D00691]
MRAAVRRLAVLVAVVAALLAVAAPATAADDADRYAADRVVVVGVPGLVWDDVDPEETPQLWDLADGAAVGALSVRAARATSCLLDGWATLGAGNRARFPGADEEIPPVPLPSAPLSDGTDAAPADPGAPATDPGAAAEPPVDARLSHCGLQEQIASLGLTDPVATVARIADDEATARFGAEPGLLGEQVGCASVVGRAATVAVATEDTQLSATHELPADPAALGGLLDGCPLTLVSLDELTDAGEPGVDPTDTGTDPVSRAAALGVVDAAVGQLRAAADALEGRTLFVVAGVSEVNDGRPQLHVAIVSGPGFDEPAWLTSASTGRTPYLQLIDLAPTALRALDLDVPASVNGRPAQAAGERPDLAEAVRQLDHLNTAASAHYRSTSSFFWSLVAVNGALVALGLLLLGGWRLGRLRGPLGAPGPRARSVLRGLALAAAALPVATYLADLVPWERAAAPRWALLGAVLVADLLVVALAAAGPWRRRPLGPALVVVLVTLATLVGDVLTGSNLEQNGLLGYDAIVAGRFTGFGNLTFGLVSTTALLATAALAATAGRRTRPERARLVTAGTVAAALVVVVAVIGAPQLGRDFGGVLASVPGFLLLAMLLTRTRVTVVRLLAILGAAVVAVGTVAVLDWLRPADARTHLGRFVDQVLTGEAWTVVSRKASANIDILLGSSLAWMLPVALVAAAWLVRPGGLLRGGRSGLPAADASALKAGLLAVALSLTLGAAVNDSGVAVPATAAALLVPLLVWLAAARGVGERTAPDEGAGEADRVTVVSRGSTAWNA